MQKRPLLLMTVFFAAGIYTGVQETNLLTTVLIWGVVILAAFICIGKRKALCICTAAFFFFGAARIGLAEFSRASIAARYAGQSFTGEMVAADFSNDGKVVATFNTDGETHRVYLRIKEPIQLYPGDVIQGDFSLEEPIRSKISFSDFSAYLCSQDVYLYAKADEVRVTGRHEKGIDGIIYSLRTYMDKVGEKYFKKDTRGFFNAMVFGDKRLLSEDLSSALQASGLNHIAVVSGMHISVIILIQSAFLGLIFGKRRYVGVFVIAGALFITAVTGAGASILRAFVMSVVLQFSKILYRENDNLTTLGSSAFLLLLINPYFLFNAGFVLSLLAVLGLILYSEKLTAAFDWIFPKSICNAMGVTAAAQLTVTPAVIMYFGVVTPYALLANLLIFSIATIFSVAGMLLFFLCKIPVISTLTAGGIQLMSDICEAICYGVSKAPGSILETGKITAFFLLGWIFVLVIIYLYPVKKYVVGKLLCVFSAALLVCNLIFPEDSMNFCFAQYGAETMTAVELSDGGMLMIDCPDAYEAEALQESVGAKANYMILSSRGQLDSASFLKESRPEALILPKSFAEDKTAKEILESAKEASVRVVFLDDKEGIGLCGAWVRYLPFEDSQGRAIEITYKGESFVTLQGLSAEEIAVLCEKKIKLECDYLKIPFRVLPEKTDPGVLSDGKIL